MFLLMNDPSAASASDGPVHAVVVLSDVRASRELEDRATFADRLEAELQHINARADGLVGRFVAQAGLDEFTGIVEPGHAGDVLRELWHRLHPVPVRYSVVMGPLDVVPSLDNGGLPPASGFDGPAFHRGAELLEELRTGSRLVAVRTSGEDRENRLMTHLADMVYGEMVEWTERQMDVALAARTGASQQEVADELGIGQSTVSRTLSAIGFPRIREALTAFCDGLDETSREQASASRHHAGPR